MCGQQHDNEDGEGSAGVVAAIGIGTVGGGGGSAEVGMYDGLLFVHSHGKRWKKG